MTRGLNLVDGNSLIYRYFHGMPFMHSHNIDGNINAVYGLAKFMCYEMLESYLDGYEPVLIVDHDGPTFRNKIFSEYKANRSKRPEQLTAQIPLTRELCRATGFPFYEVEGVEADDVIATLAYKAHEKGHKVRVSTNDKDLMQLITEDNRVNLYNPFSKKHYDWDAATQKIGVKPTRMIDYQALVGDTSDNIKGCKGVGAKTAINLIKEYGDINNILLAAETGTTRPLKLVKEHKQDVIISLKLVTLREYCDVKYPVTVTTPKLREFDEFCKKTYMNSLIGGLNRYAV